MPQLIVVALDLNIHDNLAPYNALSVREKTQRLQQAMANQYQTLSARHPDALIVFAFREYAITRGLPAETKSAAATASRFVPVDEAMIFTTAMMHLTSLYPRLIVIGGMTTIEQVTAANYRRDKLPELRAAYQEHEAIRKAESTSTRENEQQLTYHLQQIIKTEASTNKDDITIVHNICFGFQQGKMFEHHKTMPYYETKDEEGIALNNAVFQPGHGKTNQPVFEFINPDTHKPVKILVQLCREQDVADEVTAQRVAAMKEKPLLHLVLSNGANMNPDRVHGLYGIPIDSANRPKLLLTQLALSRDTVMLYRYNMLEQRAALQGPMMPLYPFEKQVLDHLDAFLKRIDRQPELAAKLQTFRDSFADASRSIDTKLMYACLQHYLDAMADSLEKMLKNTKPRYSLSAPPLLQPLKTLNADLGRLLQAAESTHPFRKDYLDDITQPLVEPAPNETVKPRQT